MDVRFAGCRLDLGARRLFRGAREVHLSPKAFDLLKMLIESRPHAVSKAELLERVWPGTFVSDASLARAVNEIRDGLGARRRRIVRTVHGYGYAFSGEVDHEPPRPKAEHAEGGAAAYWLTSARRDVALREGDQVAGRDPAADIWLESPRVSRRHACFVVRTGDVSVEDLTSKNGTFVRGTRITGRVVLTQGDEVRIGPFTFVFHRAVPRWTTETEVGSIQSRSSR